jgi:hypothetical protein
MIPKRKRSIPARLLRLTGWLGAVFILILIALVIFTETSLFRSIAKNTLIDVVDSALNAKLSIGDLQGNLFSGWRLERVRLDNADGPIATVQTIVLRYSILELFWKHISIDEVTLLRPRIFITKTASRDWNIAHLVRDTTASESKGEFDWRIIANSVRLIDGRLFVHDSSITEPLARNRLDAHRMDFDKLNLALRADITTRESRISINQFHFVNNNGDFALENISGDILLDTMSVAIEDFSVQTSRSKAMLTARIDSINVLRGIDADRFPALPLAMSLVAPSVDMRDLQYFLPSLDILGTAPSFVGRVHGNLRSLNLHDVKVVTRNSSMTFTGSLKNITDGASMLIDVSSQDAVIDGSDLPDVLPGIPLPDYSEVGRARFKKLRFVGEPLNFLAEIEMASDAGAAVGSAKLDLRGDVFVYDIDARVLNVDLARVLRRPALSSNISATGTLRGRGTTLGAMQAALDLRMDSSSFNQYRTRSLGLTAVVDNDSLRFDLAATSREGNLTMRAGMRFGKDTVLGVRVDARAGSVNLAKLLGKDSLATNLNFTLQGQTDGVSLTKSSGSIRMRFDSSRYQDMFIESDSLLLTLDQHRPRDRALTLQTPYADLSVRGAFDIPRFAGYLGAQLDSLFAGLSRFPLLRDSVSAVPAIPGRRAESSRGVANRMGKEASRPEDSDTASFMDATVKLEVKNTPSLQRYLGAEHFLMRASLEAGIHGGRTDMNIRGTLTVNDLYYYATEDRHMLAAGLRQTFDILHLSVDDTWKSLVVRTSGIAANIDVNDLEFSRTSVRLGYESRTPTFQIRSLIDTAFQVDVEGAARFRDDDVAVSLSRCNLSYQGLAWKSIAPVEAVISDSMIAVDAFALQRNGTSVALRGRRTFSGRNSFSIRVDSVRIDELEYLATSNRASLTGESFGGTASVEATVEGTDAEPLIAAEIYTPDLSYRGYTFGEFQVAPRYENRTLELYSELKYLLPDGQKRRVLTASGSLPVTIAFTGSTVFDLTHDGTRSDSLRLIMTSFPLTLTEKFVGLFSPLQGYANAELTIKGATGNPTYSGWLTVSDATGRFYLNNMDYRLGMAVRFDKRSIHIDTVSIANDSKDWTSGLVTASGKIDLDEFRINRYTVDMFGKLKVLRRASRSSSKLVYGDLFVALGDDGLHLTGQPGKSLLQGNIQIAEGNLTFAMEGQTATVAKYSNIRYIDVDDTKVETRSSFSDAAMKTRQGSLFGKGTSRDTVSTGGQAPSFFDGFQYDLAVTTVGNMRIVMPFSSLSQEELNARLNIENFKVSNWEASGKFVGEVTLGPESYYIQFGKKFAASGSLIFNGDPQNPDLKLRAVYSADHVSPRETERHKVFVIITITGSRRTPKLEWDIRLDAEDSPNRPRAGDMQSDALSFILVGLFSDELSGSGKGEFINRADDIRIALQSSIVSAGVSDLISKAGLQNVLKRVEFGGLGSASGTRVKVTSEVGRALLTYDGVINNLGYSDIVFELPVWTIFPNMGLGNMVLQASRKTSNNLINSGSSTQEDAVVEAKLLYRFSF